MTGFCSETERFGLQDPSAAQPSKSALLLQNSNNFQSLDDLSNEEFLGLVGQRVRRYRSLQRMSRKQLAGTSNVSERYLAQLESGQGNMSISLLRRVTCALGVPIAQVMAEPDAEPASAPLAKAGPMSD